MIKDSTKQIIQRTLQSSFDKEQFLNFTKNLLNHIDESKAQHFRGYVKHQFKQTTGIVKTYERLGTYTDPNEKKIDILVVYLEKDNSIDRARTSLRNFVADYLKRRDQKDAALVAFVSPNLDDWRFSLIKMDYKFQEGKDGKIKVKEEFTPARRWSFLVGAKESSHTAQSRLAPILEDDTNQPTLGQLEDAFSIEKVTKEFFEKYRELFLWLKDSLEEFVKNDPKINTDFAGKDIEVVDFAKKLLGQIVFLYFLQKKGWFGVPMDKNWGEGDKTFLRNLFLASVQEKKNYFNNYLEPLFYEALAKPRDDDYYSRFDCRIPFLNGGLFDPISDYDWVNTDIDLPSELFANDRRDPKTGDIGDGILDVFDRYNFTVREDEPLEKEVAVDPEMLGKVFENLLEVKDRKSKGTYYTPREIVHYMCEQSLINYLATELPEVDKNDLEEFIKIGDQVLENEYWIQEKGDDNGSKIPSSIKKNAITIDQKLAEIKVCDPAIGSGAFPVGMMNEIVTARLSLNPFICHSGLDPESSSLECAGRTAYDFKMQAITDSIYGVDIDPGAVEIAKLRLWLSLVVDENDIHRIKPLPNLDYKIMQGNSLLEEFEGIKLFDESIIPQDRAYRETQITKANTIISELQREYFKLHSASNLLESKEQLIIKQVREQKRLIENLRQKPEKNSNIDLFSRMDGIEAKWDELSGLHQKIVGATNRDKKKTMLSRASELEWQFIEASLKREGKTESLKKIEQFKKKNTKPFFLWHLHFADVFQSKGGFDIVIGNPPYIQLQKEGGYLADMYKNCGYKSFERTGDIYALFYENGINTLKTSGHLCFITSNKWMRASYGKSLRKLFNSYNPLLLVDLGSGIFETATVDTNILIIGKENNCDQLAGVTLNIEVKDLVLSGFIDKNKSILPKMGEDAWFIGNQDEQNLKEKIERIGKPLKDWDVKIYYGIKTGLNEAFIIDKATRDRLVVEDPKSAEILKPILRGRDIKRYGYEWAGLWIIASGFDIDVPNKYPAVFKHLKQFEDKAKKRDDQGNNWWNLRSCAYYPEFEKEKVVWSDIATEPIFTLLPGSIYFNNTVYMIISENNKFLNGVLNSNIIKWYFPLISTDLGDKGQRFFKIFVEIMPIPPITPSNRGIVEQIESTIDKILAITKSGDYLENPAKKEEVKKYEEQINQIVYKLYNLTPEEIKIVESIH